ncbi:MAG: MmgE/PrpD family protein [Chloroflexi bacterium]|nr:MmgE/PrpD family protein [Chloroflexota bacterium]
MGVTETLARFAVEKTYNDIPPGIVAVAKERILDTVGVMIGGSVERCTGIVLDLVKDIGGRPSAGVLCHKLRTSVPNAALVNGVEAHALDFDDTSISGISHISAVVLPAVMAMADDLGASGKQVLEAYILGYEVEARISMGVQPFHILKGWHPIPTLGSFGATIGCSKLLNLNLGKTRCALGIAASETGGIRKNIGTMTKPFHAGNAAKNGVIAALLGALGYSADTNVLEGVPGIGHDHFGFCATFNGENNYDLDRMVDEIGTRWDLALPNVTTKLHPGATAPAVPIDITLELVKKHDIKPEEVERVEVGATSSIASIGAFYRCPKNGLDARYSCRYGIAVAILDRRAGLQEYTDERVGRPDVQSFLKLVNVEVDPEVEDEFKREEGVAHTHAKWGASKVTIKLRDGRKFYEKRNIAKGYPEMPLQWDELVEKYRECADYASLTQKGVNAGESVGLLKDLESVENVRQLIESLTPR